MKVCVERQMDRQMGHVSSALSSLAQASTFAFKKTYTRTAIVCASRKTTSKSQN